MLLSILGGEVHSECITFDAPVSSGDFIHFGGEGFVLNVLRFS